MTRGLAEAERFEVVTFDCYGTLIDWEAGILAVLRPLLHRHGHALRPDEILELYARFESEVERGAYRSYREVLRNVMRHFATRYGFEVGANEVLELEESIAHWQPFADTQASLAKLSTRYRLVVLSNVDDDLFALTAPKLGVTLEHVITAQQLGCYKPSPEFFDRALAKLDVPKRAILHVAQSLHHDIAPARSLGLANVWVNRRASRDGFGATPPDEAQPDLEVPDLQTLVSTLNL